MMMSINQKILSVILGIVFLANTFWCVFLSPAEVIARVIWWVVSALIFLWMGGVISRMTVPSLPQIKMPKLPKKGVH